MKLSISPGIFQGLFLAFLELLLRFPPALFLDSFRNFPLVVPDFLMEFILRFLHDLFLDFH